MLADTSSYTSNVVNIQFSSSLASGAANNEATGTLQNRAANTKVYNINLKNTYGAGSQAGAISAYNTQQSYYGVGFYGYQDTVLAQTGNQLYAKCYIQGATDFIYGQHARAWFDGCDIRVSGTGYVTANGRADSSDVSYYVINKSSVETSSGSSAGAGSTYLGRPWSQYARVCFQKTVLGAVINSAGWSKWSSSTPNTAGVTFQEVCHFKSSCLFLPEPNNLLNPFDYTANLIHSSVIQGPELQEQEPASQRSWVPQFQSPIFWGATIRTGSTHLT